DHQSDAAGAGLSRLRNGQSFERRVIADVVGRVAVRDLPEDLAAIEVHGGDRAVRRLQDGDAVDGEAAGTASGRRCRCSRGGGGTSEVAVMPTLFALAMTLWLSGS